LAKEGKIPDYYNAQIQYGLLISQAKWCEYVSYSPEDPSPLVAFRVFPDQELMEKIDFAVTNFWLHNVKNKVSPLEQQESFEIKENRIKELVDKYKALKLEIDLKSSKLEDLENEIKEYLAKHEIKKTRHNGVEISFLERKGNVDYGKIPELKGVDLEKYRKNPTGYFKFTIK
jgi:predicted phage-related endonuclease